MPRPAGENAGLRDDAGRVQQSEIFKPGHFQKRRWIGCDAVEGYRAVFRSSFFRNLAAKPSRCHTLRTMSESQEPAAAVASSVKTDRVKDRPFRVKLRGSVLILIRLPNQRQLRGKLHQLSVTGGLMNVDKPLDEKLKVELIFQVGEATVREKAEMLFPMWATQGWLQPFRFVELAEESRTALEKNLMAFVQGSAV
jgi:hypothetical protein